MRMTSYDNLVDIPGQKPHLNIMSTIAAAIFIITYTGIIFTRLPWINIDRPSAAFFGSVAMILAGVLTFDEAITAIDFNTIALLIGMMIIITVLEIDGFFSLIANKTITAAKTENRLLLIIIFTTGISSAFLVNDAVVLLYTPVVISICRDCRIDPKPYLIAEILSSNTGSAMTITGNPQNMLIGINSGIPYAKFMLHLLPVSLAGMLIIYAVIKIMYWGRFNSRSRINPAEKFYEYDFLSMKYSAPVFALVIVLFFASGFTGLSIPVIALTGASLIMIFGHVRPSEVIQKVDWVLILFFASLFIVVRGIDKTGVIQSLMGTWNIGSDLYGITAIHGLSLVLSQVISNVPFTVFMIPILKGNPGDIIWLSLAAASTFAGNATIIGAMANLIVVESAERLNVRITFFEFLKPGLIVTVITLAVSVALIWIQLPFI